MAHFAKLDSENTVLQVVVVDNKDTADSDGNEVESIGIAYCQEVFGADTSWKQTSINGNIRFRYATINSTYDESRDAFIPKQPYASWLLNEKTLDWEPPIPYPAAPGSGEKVTVNYIWNEATTSWVEDI